MPQRDVGEMPAMSSPQAVSSPKARTYVVPMTADASAAQVAMMQKKQLLMSHADHIDHIDDAHDKAETAFEMAADAQERLSLTMQDLVQNQGVMYLLIACFIIMFIFLMR